MASPLAFSASVPGGIFDHCCDFLWVRHVDSMARSRDVASVAVGTFGIPPFQLWADRPVCVRDNHPAWLGSPCSSGDDSFEIVSQVGYLRLRHEGCLIGGKVSSKKVVKLCRVKVGKTVWQLLDRCGLA